MKEMVEFEVCNFLKLHLPAILRESQYDGKSHVILIKLWRRM